MSNVKILVAFAGNKLITRGVVADVVTGCKLWLDQGDEGRLSVFEDETGRVIDIDFSGTETEVLARLSPDETSQPSQKTQKERGPGRPKLGVVSREVSLLPGHWQWLNEQSGSASSILRRLVMEAKKKESGESVARRAVDAAHRFMWDIAGDETGFEEATRLLFAMDFDRFEKQTSGWSASVRGQLARYIDKARASGK